MNIKKMEKIWKGVALYCVQTAGTFFSFDWYWLEKSFSLVANICYVVLRKAVCLVNVDGFLIYKVQNQGHLLNHTKLTQHWMDFLKGVFLVNVISVSKFVSHLFQTQRTLWNVSFVFEMWGCLWRRAGNVWRADAVPSPVPRVVPGGRRGHLNRVRVRWRPPVVSYLGIGLCAACSITQAVAWTILLS